MRKIGITLLVAAFSFLSFSPSALAQEWSESELQEMYMEFLADEGIDDAFIDSDGDIQFTYNDYNFFMEVNEDDNEFFRVVMFGFWPIESQTEAVQVAFACDVVNRQMKVAKANTVDDSVWISTELFLGRPTHFKSVFWRCMNSIESGFDTFIEEM
ncbi:MAG: hypothetical protein AAFQ98_17390 [Bacteroidota bacterium]